jgi:hypothetical protein
VRPGNLLNAATVLCLVLIATAVTLARRDLTTTKTNFLAASTDFLESETPAGALRTYPSGTRPGHYIAELPTPSYGTLFVNLPRGASVSSRRFFGSPCSRPATSRPDSAGRPSVAS